MSQRLVRFDVRLDKNDYVTTFWDGDHRNRFLLKPGVEWPLSVDPLVWPSVFYSEIFRQGTKLPYGSIEVPPSTDDSHYWRNLAEMRSYYEKHKGPTSRGVPVALQIFSENDLVSDELTLVFGDSTNPGEPPPNSELLGFDVADLSGISALSNCEYSREDNERLRPVWEPRLNVFGLLTTLQYAAEFRRLSDSRVPEHSPLWVYGIWRLHLPGC